MARTKETKMFPEQQEKMTQEVMASLHPSTYGKDHAPKHNLAPSQNTLVGITAFQLSTSKVADLNSHNLRQASKSSS